jgi:acyl carrier protein
MNETEIRQKLKKYICTEIIKKENYLLSDNEPLISGGMIDSFSLVHIAVFIENEFGVRIPDTDLSVDTMDTVDAMGKRILEELKKTGT